MTEVTDRTGEARTRRFRPYPEYRDAGVEWLGEIPPHWKVGRLKDHGALFGGAGFPHDYQGTEDEVLPFYKVGDLSVSSDGRYMGQAPHTVSFEIAAELGAHVIPEDSIIYAKIGAALLLNRRRITTRACCIDNNVSAYVPHRGELASEWAFYWTTIVDFAALANPGAVPSLSEGDQADIPIAIPPMVEQRAIATFLDRETARIDGLVARKERLVELLQEKRTALITRAVTRGLDPNVPMKDSGVEWLGKIPAHWEVKKLNRLCLVRRGASPRPIDDPVYFDDKGEYAWVRIADVTASEKHLEITTQRLSELGKSKSVSLEPGELFLSIAATVGKPIITRIKCCIHDGFVYFVGLHENREYLFYLFSCGEVYKGLGKLGTQLNLNTDTIGNIHVPLPQPAEQRAIVQFVDHEAAEIDALIAKVDEAIDHLREFRTALISAAVTGKIDVREEGS